MSVGEEHDKSETHDEYARPVRRLPRRGLLAGIGAGVAGLIAGPGASAGGRGKRDKGKKSRSVTKKFRQISPILVLASGYASKYPSTLKVKGFTSSARITKVTVTLHNVTHSHAADMDILLQGPGLEGCLVMSDAVAGAIFDTRLTFDDAAKAPLSALGIPVASGTYRPSNYENELDFAVDAEPKLSRFKGLKPNGDWNLFIYDDNPGASGAISAGWSLRITVKERR